VEKTTAYNFGEALTPRTFVICGVELRPFSLGHWMILERLGSPFLSSNPSENVSLAEGVGDFLVLLLVCGQTYEDNDKMLNDEKLFRKTVKTFEKHIKKVIKKDKNWNIFHETRWVKEYLAYFVAMPNFTEKSDPSVPSGIDWKQSLYTIMRNEYHYSRSEILNMPVRRLFYEWCSFAEKNGAIQVSNTHEIEALRKIGVKV
jgi:hypothetical protein